MRFFRVLLLLISVQSMLGQHKIWMDITLDPHSQTAEIKQDVVWVNESNQTLEYLQFNDWNHAYALKNSPLAERFSDEFYIYFHIATAKNRGETFIHSIQESGQKLSYSRIEKHPDLLQIGLEKALPPGDSLRLQFHYKIKIPSSRFTKFGYDGMHQYYLRDFWLLPSRFENGAFVQYSNLNLDDAALDPSDYHITFRLPDEYRLHSDLIEKSRHTHGNMKFYELEGHFITNFSIWVEKRTSFEYFRWPKIEVVTNLQAGVLSPVQRAVLVGQVIQFVNAEWGDAKVKKLMITQADYDRNPIYGINQLPSFLRPFPDDFLFEMQFLKTYLRQWIRQAVQADPRADHRLYEGMMVHAMMKYVELNHPQQTLMGTLSNWSILQKHHLFEVPFNDQYFYYHALMMRKNLDQEDMKLRSDLIRFNEQMTNPYQAALHLKWLESYENKEFVSSSFKEFTLKFESKKTNAHDFDSILMSKCSKPVDWYFNDIIKMRKKPAYSIKIISSDRDSIRVLIRNKEDIAVPVPVYGVKKKKWESKLWLPPFTGDTLVVIPNNGYDRIAVNAENTVPEVNPRNNWKNIERKFLNRPLKIRAIRDLEDPNYNQLLYSPTTFYSLYDGISPGLRFHNKTFLDKPFTFDVTPTYSPVTQKLIGTFALQFNDFRRDSRLFHIRYFLPASYFHYAPNAAYFRFNPTVQFRFRPDDFRNNLRHALTARMVNVYRERSAFTEAQTENYSVFNLRWASQKTEMIKHWNVSTDLQIANIFGKAFAEAGWRKLTESNRQLNLRVFAGTFLYRNTTSDFFSFATFRPTDYMFDFPLYGRSESSGFFSQQFIMSEGGFKAMIDTPFVNQWLSTINGSASIWQWIEAYADMGAFKNENQPVVFRFDTGIRLNLVTDFFEVYFPIYTSNGWEPGFDNYHQRIRFMMTLSPRALTQLFTRKWF